MPPPLVTGDPRLHNLLDAVLSVASDLELGRVLRRIVEAARSLVGARYAALGVLGEDGRLSQFVPVGVDEATVGRIGRLPDGRGILGRLIREPRPLRLDDLGTHPESVGFPPHHPRMRSFLGVPILVRGEPFGNLYLTDRMEGGSFTQDDEDLVVRLATAASIAIENVRLHERLQELAVLSDRERIARDLHDKVIQRLFAAGMALQAAGRLVADDAARERIEETIDELDQTVREIRTTVFGLQHGGTPGRRVRSEVLRVVDDMSPSFLAPPEVSFDGPLDATTPDDAADDLLAVLREALVNVAKHAGATEVKVIVETGADLTLRVLDDGRGIGDADIAPREGHGLANLADRARRRGGRFVVHRRRAGGTSLLWQVPLD